MSDGRTSGFEDDEVSTAGATAMEQPSGTESVVAADHKQQSVQTTNDGDGAGGSPSTSTSAAPPPGYRLVTVHIKGHRAAAVEGLLIEVLPCHTFADLCGLALARVQDAPREYGLQAFLVLGGSLEVALEDPLTSARDTLRSFAAGASLRFVVDPAAAAAAAGSGGSGARIVRVSPLATPQRRRRQVWLRRLARVAIGVAKFVLAVEAAALLRGGLRGTLRRLMGRGGSDDDSGGGGGRVGSETEAVMDAVADYVSGRGDIRSLERFDPRVIRGALEAMDTEVLEQLDVPDVGATRAAVSEVLRQIRKDEEDAAAAAATSAASAAAAPSDADAGPGPASGAALSEPSTATATAGVAAGEDEGAGGPPASLPGFGPAPGAAAGAGASRLRIRGRDGGGGAAQP